MKNEFDRINKESLASLKAAKSRNILKHVLSPLEQAAFTQVYQPFNYPLQKGATLYINDYTCKQLLRTTLEKLDLMLNCTDKMVYFKDIPAKYRAIFEDPRIVLSLHPVLRNKLCRLQCYSLLRIMKRGRKYFEEEQNFSVSQVKTIHELFTKYNCGNLFS